MTEDPRLPATSSRAGSPLADGTVCNVTDPTFTATDLINSDCEFRLFAENSVGQSEPSLGSNLMKVQELSDGSAPEFVRGLHNVSVGLGKTLSLETEVSGWPKPLYYIHDISLRFSKNFISDWLYHKKNCIRYFCARKGFIIGAHAQKKFVTSLYDIKRAGVSNTF